MNIFTQFVQLLMGWMGMNPTNPAVVKIQEYTVKLCKFQPSAASIAAMLAASNPTVVGVIAISQAICAGVAPARVAGLANLNKDSGEVPTVNGVPIEGEFIQ